VAGQVQVAHTNGGLLHVPRRRHMLERDFECAPLAGRQRAVGRAASVAGFAQHHLVHVVAELRGEAKPGNGLISAVVHFPADSGHFLMQEILRSAQRDAPDLKVLYVLLFRGAHS